MRELVLLVLLLPAGPARDYAEGLRLLEAGHFVDALHTFEALPDPGERHRGAVEVYWSAGDPARALEEAEEGLVDAPRSAVLAHRAVAAALWVGDTERAAAHLERLADVVGSSDWDAPTSAAWERDVEGFQEEIERRSGLDRARRAALSRARWTALLALLGSVLGLVLAGRGAGHGGLRGPELRAG